MNIYSPYQDEIDKHYHKVDVTQEGVKFVLKGLRHGRTLSNLVARCILIENGKVETFVHRSTEKQRLIQFQRGYIGRDLPESFNDFPKDGSKWGIDPADSFFVAPTIQEFLAEDKKNICILEDIDSSPDDPWLAKMEIPPMFAFYDTDVYFYIDEEKPSIATIREAFSIASPTWSTMAFLTSTSSSTNSPKTFQNVDMKSLIEIAKRTEKIIVGAYDGEGYLIWHRS